MTTTPGSFKIAFYKAKYGTLFDRFIAAATFSKYSHCELVFPDGVCASSSLRDGGVRFKHIEFNHHWDVYDLNMQLDENQINYCFLIHQGEKYDCCGLLGNVIFMDWSSDNKKYCSLICSIALKLDYNAIDPGRLYNFLKYSRYIK